MKKLISRYDYKNHRKYVWKSKDPSMTKQAYKEDVDINNILRRFEVGQLQYIGNGEGIYADISEAPDYIAAQNILRRANEQFEALPASIRDRFANSPEKFLEFMNDESNYDEQLKLGLVHAKEDPETQKAIDAAKAQQQAEPAAPAAAEPSKAQA
jgi:phage internal scaffolding protein